MRGSIERPAWPGFRSTGRSRSSPSPACRGPAAHHFPAEAAHLSSYRIFSSKRTPRGAVALGAVLAACCAWAAPATDARGEETDDRPAGQLFDEVGISPELGAKLPLGLEVVGADGNAVRLGDCLGARPVIDRKSTRLNS